MNRVAAESLFFAGKRKNAGKCRKRESTERGNMLFATLKLSKTNCYLLKMAHGGYFLIDCGYERDAELFQRRLFEAGLSYKDITYLLLTHHHDDHSGLTNNIKDRNPDVCVIMHQSCKELIKQGVNHRAENGGWSCKGVKKLAEIYHTFHPEWDLRFPPYEIRNNDYIITDEDDDILQRIGLSARILFTPGHTQDSLSVLQDSHLGSSKLSGSGQSGTKTLFCGDAAADFLTWAGTKYTPPYISDLEQFYESWEKIFRLNIEKLYPAHGKPIKVEKLVKHHRGIRKLQEFSWNQ